MSKQKLISVEEAKKLEINEVKKFYENYISKSQVNFFSNFVFGNEIIDTAEGSYLTSGNKKIINAEGLLATCIQHEMDHLEGILFIDYLSKLKKTMILKKLSKQKNKIDRIVV